MTYLTIHRQQEVELPEIVEVVFLNITTDFQQGTQRSPRTTTQSHQRISVALAVALDDSGARQVAERLMYNAWVERVRMSFKTTRRYAYLEPADVITIRDVRTGVAYRVRIAKTTESRNGSIEFEAVAESQTIYAQRGSTGSAPSVAQAVYSRGATRTILLDLPMLRDIDTTVGVYMAMNGVTQPWAGAVLMESSDAGVSYASVTPTSRAATTGQTTSALGDWLGGNKFDESNTVNVKLDLASSTLSGFSELLVLAGANAAALKSGSGWEIIQYKNATLEADGTYTLSGLLRGRFGTEWAMAGHATGDTFVALSASSLTRVDLPSAEVGLARKWKGVTFQQVVTEATPFDFTNNSVSLECYSPVGIGGGRNAGGDITINWIRRTRVNGGWVDLSDAPIGEASEAYEVEVWDSTYTTLKRTITALTSPTATYTAAQQGTDFGSAQAKVYVKVFQISATNGRGYAGLGSI